MCVSKQFLRRYQVFANVPYFRSFWDVMVLLLVIGLPLAFVTGLIAFGFALALYGPMALPLKTRVPPLHVPP